jgi:hypothetical protein
VIVDHTGATQHVRQVKLGDHLCLPFDNDDERREVVAPFMVDGLARGERVLYFADRTSPEVIGSWLADRGIDAARAAAEGRLEIRPVGGSYTVGGRFDPDVVITTLWVDVRQARDAGYPGLRMTGEMTSELRPFAETSLLRDFEHRLSAVFDSRELAAICQYDQRLFDSAAVTGLVACHPGIVQIDPLHDDRRLRIVPTFAPRGLRIVGVVDMTTADALRLALEQATGWPEADVRLDLRDLEFIDVAGVRAIVRAAGALPPGRRLLVARLAAGLRKVFGVVGWDRAPGLVLVEEVDPP